MPQWERRLIEKINRWIPELTFLAVTLIALYIRRGGLWHVSFDFHNQFYSELPTYLHTPFYTLFIRLISYVPITPIRTVKIIYSLADFGVAACSVLLLKSLMRPAPDRRLFLTCFALLLVSPLVIENGLIWIHGDSVCFCLALCAVLAARRGKTNVCGLLLGVAAAFCAHYLVLPILFFGCGIAGKLPGHDPALKKRWTLPCIVSCLGFIVPNIAACFLLHIGLKSGLTEIFRWLITDPSTGAAFSGFVPWVGAMAGYYAYTVSLSVLLLAFCRPRWRGCAAVLHILSSVYLAFILQQGFGSVI